MSDCYKIPSTASDCYDNVRLLQNIINSVRLLQQQRQTATTMSVCNDNVRLQWQCQTATTPVSDCNVNSVRLLQQWTMLLQCQTAHYFHKQCSTQTMLTWFVMVRLETNSASVEWNPCVTFALGFITASASTQWTSSGILVITVNASFCELKQQLDILGVGLHKFCYADCNNYIHNDVSEFPKVMYKTLVGSFEEKFYMYGSRVH